LLLVACGDTSVTPADGGAGDASGGCVPCVIDTDCTGGGVCAQFGGDSYCASSCPNGNECGPDTTCTAVTTVAGDPASVCVPKVGCGAPSPNKDGGVTSDAGNPLADAGPVTSQIGNDGGTESRLYFAVVGDTRPSFIDATASYPTATITKLFQEVAALNPAPPFAVTTGDYIFASNTVLKQAAPQLKLYLGARAAYPGTMFYTMGNHECTSATASNCGPGNADGTPNNYTQFMATLLAPLGKTLPYYVVTVDATDKSWTAKYVFVAGNAWDAAQAAWLDQALAVKTTYTFIMRHEPAAATTAPGTTPSEQIMAKHPYTLAIVGHTHTYDHPKTREIIVGNGGAPLTSGSNFGYALVTQRVDGAVQIDMFDMATQKADLAFRFALKPDGTPAP
jgi:predicted phosphodiesterase